MNELTADIYFDLTGYKHKILFDPSKPVWEALQRLGHYLATLKLGEIKGKVDPRAYLIDPHLITIEEGAVVEPGAYIKGPCYIGKGSVIRHGAYLRGNILTGVDCVIGHDTEVKSAIFLDRVHAAHFAYVGDSILGNDVNLGAGTKCANLRFDDGNIHILFEGKKKDTGTRKLGAILGDKVQTGCNSVTNPGTLMGKGSFCLPCVNVSGIIPAGAVVENSHKPIVKS
jgi:NDP-sugar pyrophosphorylase family protein